MLSLSLSLSLKSPTVQSPKGTTILAFSFVNSILLFLCFCFCLCLCYVSAFVCKLNCVCLQTQPLSLSVSTLQMGLEISNSPEPKPYFDFLVIIWQLTPLFNPPLIITIIIIIFTIAKWFPLDSHSLTLQNQTPTLFFFFLWLPSCQAVIFFDGNWSEPWSSGCGSELQQQQQQWGVWQEQLCMLSVFFHFLLLIQFLFKPCLFHNLLGALARLCWSFDLSPKERECGCVFPTRPLGTALFFLSFLASRDSKLWSQSSDLLQGRQCSVTCKYHLYVYLFIWAFVSFIVALVHWGLVYFWSLKLFPFFLGSWIVWNRLIRRMMRSTPMWLCFLNLRYVFEILWNWKRGIFFLIF